MFLAHSFRLRDPWQREAADDGATRWTRGFHRPTGLEGDDALWLVISGLPENASVFLNGQQLGATVLGATGVSPVRTTDESSTPTSHDAPASPPPHNQFEVTHLLADANQIEIVIPPSDPQPPASSSPRRVAHGDLQPPFPYDVRLGIIGHS
jgi:hypothetical protein